MKVGIVGYGVLGHALERALKKGAHDICIYDKFNHLFSSIQHRRVINGCDLTFLSVPTNELAADSSCDLSQIEDCVRWIESPICIKSTIPPGTVDRLSLQFNKWIAFSPEYLGEQKNHPWTEIESSGFVIVGGMNDIQDLVIRVLSCCFDSKVAIHRTDAKTAELCKYMENCYLATKVAFVNQFYDIATTLGVDFQELRRLWLHDDRIGSSHTTVTAERGFGGRCLPKDLHAMIAVMKNSGSAPLLEAVSAYNACIRMNAKEGANVLLHQRQSEYEPI